MLAGDRIVAVIDLKTDRERRKLRMQHLDHQALRVVAVALQDLITVVMLSQFATTSAPITLGAERKHEVGRNRR